MKSEELKACIEAQGYKVKSIREFQKTFHITYSGSKWSITAFYMVPLSSVVWEKIKHHFSRVKK